MKTGTGFFEGRENTKLFYQYWLPENDDFKAYIIALHGWGTHSDRMKVPAEYFTQEGYAIYSFDLRGHWRNAGEAPGHIDSIDHLQKDIMLFMDIVRLEANDKKIFLMGQSFGGLVCILYAIEHPSLPGVIVSSPMIRLAKNFSFTKKLGNKIAAPLSKISPNKTIKIMIDQNLLTSDLKILRSHIADKKKIDFISLRTAAEIERSMKFALENASRLLCPILILQGEKDKINDNEATKAFYEGIKSQDKNLRMYEGFLNELWNEKGRMQVYRDMWIWLEKHR
jgi:alpha-beta hydrolase superfamily lysophospholipase